MITVTDARQQADEDRRQGLEHLRLVDPEQWLSHSLEWKKNYNCEWDKWDKTIG